MEDVLVVLFWTAVFVIGGGQAYVDRGRAIDARRVASFVDWIERPLVEPPGETDWDAFERRVERELRDAAQPPTDVVLPYAPTFPPRRPGRERPRSGRS